MPIKEKATEQNRKKIDIINKIIELWRIEK